MKIILSVVLIITGLISEPLLSQENKSIDTISITDYQKEIVSYLTGKSQSEFSFRSSPKERHLAAKYIMEEFKSLGIIPHQHKYRMPNVNPFVDLIFKPYKGSNVYAVLEASSPTSDYIVVGAHYDTEPNSPGAVDNATGVAMVLALAHELSMLEKRNFNFLFVLFDQEEDDEVGSKAFVTFLEDNIPSVHSVHVTDIIGWGEMTDLTFTIQTNDSLITELYYSNGVIENIGLEFIDGRGHSDNKSFSEAGYPTAGFFGSEITPHHHKPTDTYETVNFEVLRRATQFLFNLLKNMEGASNEL